MRKFAIVILSLTAAVSALAQTKTVTNADLEKYRKERVENEKKLKERYAELGFPSPEEIERQNAERRAAMEEYSDELRERRQMSQNDIVAQANALRLQIASVDAQINYLRRQNRYSSNQNFVYSYGYTSYGARGGRSAFPKLNQFPPRVPFKQRYATIAPSTQIRANPTIRGVRTGGSRFNYGGGRGFYRGGYAAFAPVIVGGNYDSNNATDELIYLEQTKAGLLAQWQILEERARRAGIRID